MKASITILLIPLLLIGCTTYLYEEELDYGQVLENTQLRQPASAKEPLTIEDDVVLIGEVATMEIGYYNNGSKTVNLSVRNEEGHQAIECEDEQSNSYALRIDIPPARLAPQEAIGYKAILINDLNIPSKTLMCEVAITDQKSGEVLATNVVPLLIINE